MTAPAGRRIALGLAWCAALAICACGRISDDAQRSSLAALTRPDSRAVAPHTPPTKRDFEPPDPHCPSFRSNAPLATLPPPGRMPRGSYMERIQRRKLWVGVDENTLGLGYFNPIASKPEGFEVDLVRQIARAIVGSARKIRYTAISTSQRKAAILNGDVDLVASSFSLTCRRRKAMLFSSVYYRAQMRLLVPKRPKVSGLGDLRGKRVCVTEQSTTIKKLAELAAATGIEIYVVPLRSDCLVKLQEGEVQAIASDDAILYGLREQDPQTEIVGPGLKCESWAIAISKRHPELVSFVNAVLERLRRNGFITRRRQFWLKGLVPPSVVKPCS